MANKERKITFLIGAKNSTKKVFKSVTSGLNKMKKLGITAGKTFAKGFGVGVVAVTALTTALGALIVNVTETQDKLGKTSDKLGLSTKALAGLHLAAEEAGIGTNTLDMGLQRMTRRLSEAAKGTGEAKDAIKELGLDAQELNQMSPDKAMIKLVDALDKVDNQADKVRLAFKLFDSEGVALVNLTRKGMKEAAKDTEAFGTALGRDAISKMEAFNDNLGKIWEAVKGFATQLTAEVVPVLNVLLEKAVAFAREGSLAEWGRKAGEAIAEMIPKIIEFVRVAGTAFVRTIPQALIFMLDIIGKVALAFSGWKLIWNGLSQGWIALQIVILEGVKKIAQGALAIAEATNIGGKFDEDIARIKNSISDFDGTIATLDVKLNSAVTEQTELLNETDAHQKKIKEYEQSIKGMEGAFDSFADSMSSAMKGAADESIAQIERVKEKASGLKFGNLAGGGSADLDEMRKQFEEQNRRGG